QGVLDLADDAGRPGGAALRRQRRAGDGHARGDLQGRRRAHGHRPEARGPRAARARRRPGPGSARHALQRAAAVRRMSQIRLGRIAYANMAPLFFRLDVDAEEIVDVPTALNRMVVAGEIDVAPISSIAYARNA